MTELAALVRQQIATAAGVPQTLLDEAANFATANVDNERFYTQAVIPDAVMIEGALNEQIFKPQGLELKLDYQSLDLFQKDENERSDALAKLVAAGLPIDLAMEILGFDLPDGMEYATVAQRILDDNARKLAEARETIQLQAQARPARDDEDGQRPPPQPTRAVRDELDRWRRKSLSALKGGESPDVAFDTDLLGDDEQKALHERLASAGDAEEVKAAFEWPFRQHRHDDDEGEAYP